MYTTIRSIIASFAKIILLEMEEDIPSSVFIDQMAYINKCLREQKEIVIPSDSVVEFESKQALNIWLQETVKEIPDYKGNSASLVGGVVGLLMIEWCAIDGELWFKK